MIKLLCLGDVVGKCGLEYLESGVLRELHRKYKPDIVIVNGENAAESNGLSKEAAERLYDCGADVITGGNHTWKRRDLYRMLDDGEYLIRPANYPAEAPGMGYTLVEAAGYTVLVMNLLGCVYMEPLASPFETMDRILNKESGRYDIAVCDFHAEATSEKLALARHADGRLSALWGTHTHIPTADIRILPGGTGYITDLGMCGSDAGVLGVKTECILHKFRVKTPVVFEPAEGSPVVNGAYFEIDTTTKKCIKAERVSG